MSQVQSPDPVQTGAHAAKSREVFSKMIGLLGLKAEVKDNVNGNKIVLNVLTEEPGRLIGRNGVHLNSLSILMNNILRKDVENFPKVFIDVDGYGKGNNSPSEKRDQEQARREERRKERFEDRPERPPREERPPRGERQERGPRKERGERPTPAPAPAAEGSPAESAGENAAPSSCDEAKACTAPAASPETQACAGTESAAAQVVDPNAATQVDSAPAAAPSAEGENAGPSRSFPSRNPGRRDREERGDESRRDRFERRDDRGPRNDRGPRRDDRGPRRDDRGPGFHREERPAYNNETPVSAESAAERLALDCKNAAKEVKKWGDDVLLKPMSEDEARKAVQFFSGDAEITASFDEAKRRVRVSLRTK
ncbi:MAG: hypothetical protein RL095_112 [Verrucomicrobiota bacterium]|jgi:predicted RNA-binding protein Jag